MSKFLIRVVSCLLVFCLLADRSVALAFTNLPTTPPVPSLLDNQVIFRDRAIVEALGYFFRDSKHALDLRLPAWISRRTAKEIPMRSASSALKDASFQKDATALKVSVEAAATGGVSTWLARQWLDRHGERLDHEELRRLAVQVAWWWETLVFLGVPFVLKLVMGLWMSPDQLHVPIWSAALMAMVSYVSSVRSHRAGYFTYEGLSQARLVYRRFGPMSADRKKILKQIAKALLRIHWPFYAVFLFGNYNHLLSWPVFFGLATMAWGAWRHKINNDRARERRGVPLLASGELPPDAKHPPAGWWKIHAAPDRIEADWAPTWNVERAPYATKVMFSDSIKGFWRAFFKRQAQRVRFGRMIELGCGNLAASLLSNELLPNFRRLGIELAPIYPASIKYAEGIFTLVGDIQALPVASESMDAVISNVVVEYTALHRSLPEIYRVLMPDGEAAFVMHRRDSPIMSSAQKTLKMRDLIHDEQVIARMTVSFLTNDWTQISAVLEKLKKLAEGAAGHLIEKMEEIVISAEEEGLEYAFMEWIALTESIRFFFEHLSDLAFRTTLFGSVHEIEEYFYQHGFVLAEPIQEISNNEGPIAWALVVNKWRSLSSKMGRHSGAPTLPKQCA